MPMRDDDAMYYVSGCYNLSRIKLLGTFFHIILSITYLLNNCAMTYMYK